MAEKNNIPQFVNSDSFMADKNYVKWLSDLKKRFHAAQHLRGQIGVRRMRSLTLGHLAHHWVVVMVGT